MYLIYPVYIFVKRDFILIFNDKVVDKMNIDFVQTVKMIEFAYIFVPTTNKSWHPLYHKYRVIVYMYINDLHFS